MNEDDINVPEVEVEDPHWKVGDGMRDEQGRPDFVIGQMAIVSKGKFAPGSGKPGSAKYDIVFFDVEGNERGRLHVTEDESAMACGPTAFGSSGIKDDIINVPEVEVEDPHWKVGDGIGQVAIVNKGKVGNKTKYDIVFFDVEGNECRRLATTED